MVSKVAFYEGARRDDRNDFRARPSGAKSHAKQRIAKVKASAENEKTEIKFEMRQILHLPFLFFLTKNYMKCVVLDLEFTELVPDENLEESSLRIACAATLLSDT